jgi:hypothetical protein
VITQIKITHNKRAGQDVFAETGCDLLQEAKMSFNDWRRAGRRVISERMIGDNGANPREGSVRNRARPGVRATA